MSKAHRTPERGARLNRRSLRQRAHDKRLAELQPPVEAGEDDALDEVVERIVDIDPSHRAAAHALNHEASQLALRLFPDDLAPWPTDEPMPDLRPLWEETNHGRRRRRPYVENFDLETLPLFDDWIANLDRLHQEDI